MDGQKHPHEAERNAVIGLWADAPPRCVLSVLADYVDSLKAWEARRVGFVLRDPFVPLPPMTPDTEPAALGIRCRLDPLMRLSGDLSDWPPELGLFVLHDALDEGSSLADLMPDPRRRLERAPAIAAVGFRRVAPQRTRVVLRGRVDLVATFPEVVALVGHLGAFLGDLYGQPAESTMDRGASPPLKPPQARYLRYYDDYVQRNQHAPSEEEAAQALNLSPRHIAEIKHELREAGQLPHSVRSLRVQESRR